MNVFPVIAFALTLSACATPPAGTPPGCHGPVRPANPNGSVLAPDAVPPAPPAGPAAGGCGSPS
jgi:hypothetical protein